MKHLKIEEIIEKRFEKIDEAFEKARQHFQEDDIRVFRVKMKKLMACLQLMDSAKTHGQSIKLPSGIIKLNQFFGTIRTLQMQQTFIENTAKEKQTGLPEIYLKFVSDQIILLMKDFSKYIKSAQPFKKEEEKLLVLLPKQLSRKAILQFVRTEGDALEKLFAPVFPADKSFHDARKHFKNLLYVSPYINVEMSDLSPYNALTSFEDIDAFTKILGNFHDLDTALDCLHISVHKIEPDEDEKFILRRLEQIWLAERGAFRVQIYDELQKITASGRTKAAPVEWVVM